MSGCERQKRKSQTKGPKIQRSKSDSPSFGLRNRCHMDSYTNLGSSLGTNFNGPLVPGSLGHKRLRVNRFIIKVVFEILLN